MLQIVQVSFSPTAAEATGEVVPSARATANTDVELELVPGLALRAEGVVAGPIDLP